MHSRRIDAAAGDLHHLDYIEVERQRCSLRLVLPSRSQPALVELPEVNLRWWNFRKQEC